MKDIIEKFYNEWNEDGDFSGVFSVSGPDGVIFEKVRGYRNLSEKLPNTADTAIAVASGTKTFTGLAVCKLIDEGRLSPKGGKLTLESKLHDLLPYDLGQINKDVTVFHLLTHTSGVGDYIDEDAEDSEARLAALYAKYPCYLWTRLDYYLQMITHLPPKFAPGARFGYSNAGYVLLGLVIEAVTGMTYQRYVQENIIKPNGLTHTGFYRMDDLPANTAFGYLEDEDTGDLRANIFNVPIMGGSDGGIFTCAADLDKLWRAIFENKILSEAMTQAFLSPQVVIDEEEGESYGLGVYRDFTDGKLAYTASGWDAGVSFFSSYYPRTKIVASAIRNTEMVASGLRYDLFNEFA